MKTDNYSSRNKVLVEADLKGLYCDEILLVNSFNQGFLRWGHAYSVIRAHVEEPKMKTIKESLLEAEKNNIVIEDLTKGIFLYRHAFLSDEEYPVCTILNSIEKSRNGIDTKCIKNTDVIGIRLPTAYISVLGLENNKVPVTLQISTNMKDECKTPLHAKFSGKIDSEQMETFEKQLHDSIISGDKKDEELRSSRPVCEEKFVTINV